MAGDAPAGSSSGHAALDRRAVRRRGPGPAGHRRARHRARSRLLPRPARHPARQDADARGVRRRAARRRHGAVDARAQGHLATAVYPVFDRAGARHAALDGRRRPRARARPDHVPGPALGAAHRLGALRHPLPRRRAGPVLDAPAAARRSTRLAAARLRATCRARGRVPRLPLDAPRPRADTGQPGEPPLVAPLTHGYQLLPRTASTASTSSSSSCATGSPRSTCRCARSSSSSGPSQLEVDVRARPGAATRPTTWCCCAAP